MWWGCCVCASPVSMCGSLYPCMASSDEEIFLDVPTSGKALRPQIQVTVSRPASVQEASNGTVEPSATLQTRSTESATTFGFKETRKLTASSRRSVRSESIRDKTPHTDRIKGLMKSFINKARRRQLRSQDSGTLTPESSSIANVSSVTGATEMMKQRLQSYIGLEPKEDSDDDIELLNCRERLWRFIMECLIKWKNALSPIDPLGKMLQIVNMH